MIILSGGPGGERNSSGVSFIVAPNAKKSVITFNQFSDRIASLKLRVRGGQCCLVSCYAPHGGLDFSLRWSFYDVLSGFLHGVRCHGPVFLM